MPGPFLSSQSALYISSTLTEFSLFTPDCREEIAIGGCLHCTTAYTTPHPAALFSQEKHRMEQPQKTMGAVIRGRIQGARATRETVIHHRCRCTQAFCTFILSYSDCHTQKNLPCSHQAAMRGSCSALEHETILLTAFLLNYKY